MLKKIYYGKNVYDNKEINAVCIALPAEMHYEFARKSLIAGKDVYVEKPITLDVNEAEELVKLAKDNDKIIMVGHLKRVFNTSAAKQECPTLIRKMKFVVTSITLDRRSPTNSVSDISYPCATHSWQITRAL